MSTVNEFTKRENHSAFLLRSLGDKKKGKKERKKTKRKMKGKRLKGKEKIEKRKRW